MSFKKTTLKLYPGVTRCIFFIKKKLILLLFMGVNQLVYKGSNFVLTYLSIYNKAIKNYLQKFAILMLKCMSLLKNYYLCTYDVISIFCIYRCFLCRYLYFNSI